MTSSGSPDLQTSPACAVHAFRAIRELFRNSTRARPPMAGVASADRLLRLMRSRKVYSPIPDPADHPLSPSADVTATSRISQHLRGRRVARGEERAERAVEMAQERVVPAFERQRW